MRLRTRLIQCLLASCIAWLPAAAQDKVLKVVPHSNLTILDPIWTTAYITRNHGYLVYDTLFATDASGAVKPQMVDTWSAAADKKTYTFTLREGLLFHDDQPVTSEDVVASLARWGKRDAMGQELMQAVDKLEAVDAKTFRIVLKEPYGLVIESLGKPSSNVPFIMPKRVAETPADKQIGEFTGSGPFIFKKDDWKPGEKVVYVKNAKYKPRSEAPSGLAGGKAAKIDRVEWIIIKDPQTQVNALLAGEVDVLEMIPFELYNSLKAKSDIRIVNLNPAGFHAMLRFNHLHPPFNNAKIRQAAALAMNQDAVLRTQVGVAELYWRCNSMYPCKSPYASSGGTEAISFNMKRARQLLKEAGYDGTPVVVMQPTDVTAIAKLPVVATQLLRQAGFRVDMQAMDWQTLVSRRAKKDPPAQGGWNVFLTVWSAPDGAHPGVAMALNGGCDKAWFGWPCDAEIEKLRDKFARAGSEAERKALAQQVQARAAAIVTHVPLGEYMIPTATRTNIDGLLPGFLLTFWNVEKR